MAQATKLRLFAIRNRSGQLIKGEDGSPLYFSDKRAAKAVRDKTNHDGNTTPSQELFVTLGPDHKRNQPNTSGEQR